MRPRSPAAANLRAECPGASGRDLPPEAPAGIAAAQLAGEDFLAGLDRQCADAAGQQVTPMPGLSSTTAAGLGRRITGGQWQAVETGVAAVTGRMVALLPSERAAALAGGPVTIDLDATDV